MTTSQHLSTPADSSAAAAPAADSAPVAAAPLPDVKKMRAELERLMGKPDAPSTDKPEGDVPAK